MKIVYCARHDGVATAALRTALTAIVTRFEDNDDPRDWPAEIHAAQRLLRDLAATAPPVANSEAMARNL